MLTIQLPARASDDLNWSKPKQEALHAIERGDEIFWEFDLGLSLPYFPLEDELLFRSLSLSLSTFTQELWPVFQKNSRGICLYKGSVDFSSFFIWSENQFANWNEWIGNRAKAKKEHLRRLFCADSFALYFQMLSHNLPDEMAITLILDGAGCGSLSETLQLLSKERFEHFSLQVQSLSLTESSSLAVCFPEESQCTQEVLEKLDQIFDTLEKPIRVIQEPFLTEGWEGVEYLYVLSEALQERGKRKLMGFCAAGGTVIVEGKPIGLEQEINSQEIRGRGIRTPGLLVPNQSR